MPKATWNGAVLAEGDDVVVVEGNLYFSRDQVQWDHFKPASNTTVCGWKGTANYYDIEVDGAVNRGAAWYYADPKAAAESVRDRVAFWKGVTVEGAPSVKPGPAAPPRDACDI